MAITTSIARHYAVRLIVMTIVMFVLGVWGVYDYFVAIPAQQRAFDRYQALSLTQQALQPDAAGGQLAQAVTDATQAIDHEIDLLLDDHAARIGIERSAIEGPNWRQLILVQAEESNEIPANVTALPGYAESQQLAESLRAKNELEWTKALLLFQQALVLPRAPGGGLNELQRSVYQLTEEQMSLISKDEVPTPPSTFDHVVQLAYVSLLLCVPYFIWLYLGTVKRVYKLDDDGTLHSPEGTWPASDIADIDMSRWMAKSVAHVVHADGSRLMLDDYKHRDMHRIIGALANKYHAEEWTPEAKPVKAESEDGEEAAPEELIEEEAPR